VTLDLWEQVQQSLSNHLGAATTKSLSENIMWDCIVFAA
jgi:hypothetical protein